MITQFESFLDNNKNDTNYKNNLKKIVTVIEKEYKILEKKENTELLHGKYKKIVMDIVNKNKLKNATKTELLKLKNMFEYVEETYERLDYCVEWKYVYSFNSIVFYIGYNGDNEGEGSKYFYLDDIIKIGDIENNKYTNINFDKIYEFYKSLNLKYVSLYLLIKLIMSVATVFCDYCDDFDIDIDIIYENELCSKKYNNMKKNISYEKLLNDKYYICDHTKIGVYVENFDIMQEFEKQEWEVSYHILYNDGNMIYKDDNGNIRDTKHKKNNIVKIDDSNREFFNDFFNKN